MIKHKGTCDLEGNYRTMDAMHEGIDGDSEVFTDELFTFFDHDRRCDLYGFPRFPNYETSYFWDKSFRIDLYLRIHD